MVQVSRDMKSIAAGPSKQEARTPGVLLEPLPDLLQEEPYPFSAKIHKK